MSKWHGYYLVERLQIGDESWKNLVSVLDLLGTQDIRSENLTCIKISFYFNLLCMLYTNFGTSDSYDPGSG